MFVFLYLQVLAKTQEDEAMGWWSAKIKMFRGEFADLSTNRMFEFYSYVDQLYNRLRVNQT